MFLYEINATIHGGWSSPRKFTVHQANTVHERAIIFGRNNPLESRKGKENQSFHDLMDYPTAMLAITKHEPLW